MSLSGWGRLRIAAVSGSVIRLGVKFDVFGCQGEEDGRARGKEQGTKRVKGTRKLPRPKRSMPVSAHVRAEPGAIPKYSHLDDFEIP